MTEQQIRDIEEGARRWHSVSAESVKKLLERVRELEAENRALRAAVSGKEKV